MIDLGEQALTILQIAAWSQIGVLVRIYLDLFFTDGCNGAWGVCLLSQGKFLRHGQEDRTLDGCKLSSVQFWKRSKAYICNLR